MMQRIDGDLPLLQPASYRRSTECNSVDSRNASNCNNIVEIKIPIEYHTAVADGGDDDDMKDKNCNAINICSVR